MGNNTFVDHLAYLNQLGELDIALLYQSLDTNQLWPQHNGEALSPSALILFAAARLADRLAPDTTPDEHPELSVIGHCVGAFLYQTTAMATIAKVAIAPAMVEGQEADKVDEGMRHVGLGVAQILSMVHDMPNGVMVIEEEESGEAETAEPRD